MVFTDAQKEKYRRLMGDGIFRLSVGIENVEDIIDDLRQALEKLPISNISIRPAPHATARTTPPSTRSAAPVVAAACALHT